MSALRIALEILKDGMSYPIYPVVAPQTMEQPFAVISLIHEAQDFVIEGANPAFTSRISVACHGPTPAAAEELAEEVKSILETILNHTLMDGSSPPIPWAGATFWKEGTDIHDFSDDRTVFRRIMDWRLRWWRLA